MWARPAEAGGAGARRRGRGAGARGDTAPLLPSAGYSTMSVSSPARRERTAGSVECLGRQADRGRDTRRHALGGVDYYVVGPATARRGFPRGRLELSPRVGDRAAHRAAHRPHRRRGWSGRAYELRDVFERCAAPHAFWLADSDEGRGSWPRQAPTEAPAHDSPRRPGPERPLQMPRSRSRRGPGRLRPGRLRRRDRRRGPGWPVGSRLRRRRRTACAGGRRRRYRRTSQV